MIAGPDPLDAGKAYSLALPPPRHTALKNFRVLLIDTDPVMPTDKVVRGALERLADESRQGRRQGRPQQSAAARLRGVEPALYADADVVPRGLLCAGSLCRRAGRRGGAPAEDNSLAAERLRGIALSHRDWLMADGGRSRLRAQWRELFKTYDAVICPIMPTPAYPHDHSADQESRRIKIDGKDYVYPDQLAWPGIATLPGLPSTAIPTGFAPDGLPVGVQIVGPWLEDRTPLKLAELIEREFGGFKPPPMFDD